MNPSDSSSAAQFVQTPSSPTAAQAPVSAPAAWPGAFGIFSHSRDAVIRNFSNYLILIALDLAIGAALSALTRSMTGGAFAFITSVISILIGVAFSGVFVSLNLAAAKGGTVSFDRPLVIGLRAFWKLLVVDLIKVAMVIAGMVLLVLPVFFVIFYVFPRLSLSSFFIVDETKHMGPFAAMAASWQATDGNLGKVWGLIGVTILIALPIITIIGVFVTIVLAFLYSAAWAFLYLNVIRPEASPNPTAPAAS